MSILKLILKAAAPRPKLENFSRYLFIGPHPDDIEIGCGATVSKLASLGKEIAFLICFDGRYGLETAPSGTTADELADIRKAEAIESAKRLGVDEVHFISLSDGGFYDNLQLRRLTAQRIGIFKPDVVFTVDPDVTSECHIDHLNAGRETKTVVNFASNREIMANYGAEPADVSAIAFYMTAKPNVFIKTKGHVKKQLDSIFSVHISQFPKDCPQSIAIAKYIKLRAFFFGLRSFKGQAEGFRVLGVTHMHCMPEAGN
ncbi:MAG: PIG-L deacetylase family protein [Sphaerochaeta sp.]